MQPTVTDDEEPEAGGLQAPLIGREAKAAPAAAPPPVVAPPLVAAAPKPPAPAAPAAAAKASPNAAVWRRTWLLSLSLLGCTFFAFASSCHSFAWPTAMRALRAARARQAAW